ncbi:hypothetical protein WR25_14034 [Diploscapter pachys]|uniref:Uncharacterized protein n=1 Tax=Diploscapter pachys TaxID=2018661 RepID=A0A2A2K127_9BILA|nr:hypothetical protein WR25_14034 [Diploscapter pachys]
MRSVATRSRSPPTPRTARRKLLMASAAKRSTVSRNSAWTGTPLLPVAHLPVELAAGLDVERLRGIVGDQFRGRAPALLDQMVELLVEARLPDPVTALLHVAELAAREPGHPARPSTPAISQVSKVHGVADGIRSRIVVSARSPCGGRARLADEGGYGAAQPCGGRRRCRRVRDPVTVAKLRVETAHCRTTSATITAMNAATTDAKRRIAPGPPRRRRICHSTERAATASSSPIISQTEIPSMAAIAAASSSDKAGLSVTGRSIGARPSVAKQPFNFFDRSDQAHWHQAFFLDAQPTAEPVRDRSDTASRRTGLGVFARAGPLPCVPHDVVDDELLRLRRFQCAAARCPERVEVGTLAIRRAGQRKNPVHVVELISSCGRVEALAADVGQAFLIEFGKCSDVSRRLHRLDVAAQVEAKKLGMQRHHAPSRRTLQAGRAGAVLALGHVLHDCHERGFHVEHEVLALDPACFFARKDAVG